MIRLLFMISFYCCFAIEFTNALIFNPLNSQQDDGFSQTWVIRNGDYPTLQMQRTDQIAFRWRGNTKQSVDYYFSESLARTCSSGGRNELMEPDNNADDTFNPINENIPAGTVLFFSSVGNGGCRPSPFLKVEILPLSTPSPTSTQVTSSPVTSEPTTSTPTFGEPNTLVPTTRAPTTSTPTTRTPTTSAPTTRTPTTSTPTTRTPTTSTPTNSITPGTPTNNPTAAASPTTSTGSENEPINTGEGKSDDDDSYATNVAIAGSAVSIAFLAAIATVVAIHKRRSRTLKNNNTYENLSNKGSNNGDGNSFVDIVVDPNPNINNNAERKSATAKTEEEDLNSTSEEDDKVFALLSSSSAVARNKNRLSNPFSAWKNSRAFKSTGSEKPRSDSNQGLIDSKGSTISANSSSISSSKIAMRESMEKSLVEFYTRKDPEKLRSLQSFMDLIDKKGIDSFNNILQKRYGEKISIPSVHLQNVNV